MGSKNLDWLVTNFNPIHDIDTHGQLLTKEQLNAAVNELTDDYFGGEMKRARVIIVGEYKSGETLFEQVDFANTGDNEYMLNGGGVVVDHAPQESLFEFFNLNTVMYGEYDEAGTNVIVDLCNDEGHGLTVDVKFAEGHPNEDVQSTNPINTYGLNNEKA